MVRFDAAVHPLVDFKVTLFVKSSATLVDVACGVGAGDWMGCQVVSRDLDPQHGAFWTKMAAIDATRKFA